MTSNKDLIEFWFLQIGFSVFSNAVARNLQIRASDHAPILLNLYAPTSLFKPFRFIATRCKDLSNKEVISRTSKFKDPLQVKSNFLSNSI